MGPRSNCCVKCFHLHIRRESVTVANDRSNKPSPDTHPPLKPSILNVIEKAAMPSEKSVVDEPGFQPCFLGYNKMQMNPIHSCDIHMHFTNFIFKATGHNSRGKCQPVTHYTCTHTHRPHRAIGQRALPPSRVSFLGAEDQNFYSTLGS